MPAQELSERTQSLFLRPIRISARSTRYSVCEGSRCLSQGISRGPSSRATGDVGGIRGTVTRDFSDSVFFGELGIILTPALENQSSLFLQPTQGVERLFFCRVRGCAGLLRFRC